MLAYCVRFLEAQTMIQQTQGYRWVLDGAEQGRLVPFARATKSPFNYACATAYSKEIHLDLSQSKTIYCVQPNLSSPLGA